MNNQTERTDHDLPISPLSGWIGSVLLAVNTLLTVIGSIMIFRYSRMATKVFNDFDFEVPMLTQLTMSLPFAALFPLLGVLGIVVHLVLRKSRNKVICQTVIFVLILVLTTLFVVTALPVMSQLINSLE